MAGLAGGIGPSIQLSNPARDREPRTYQAPTVVPLGERQVKLLTQPLLL